VVVTNRKIVANRNIKEGGYQPVSDPPPPPSGEVPTQSVNPITGNPGRPGSPPPSPTPERSSPSPPQPSSDGN
jgi:hypothetical protein